MRFLANENIPWILVKGLRDLGHDVAWVKETLRGRDDATIPATASAEQRVLVTFDKGFGELAFRSRLPAACGIVLLRLSGASSEQDRSRAIAALRTRDEWAGYFTVITDDHIRLRPMPIEPHA